MGTTDVAVIMINYNASAYTLECVRSVMEHTSNSISYQITVVDNNSEPKDFQHLENNFPEYSHIKLIRSDINLGFGGGNMLGAANAKARYYLFLNNDTLLLNDCLRLLTTFMDRNPDVGVCTAQNYNEHGELVPSFDHNKGLRRLVLGRGYLEKKDPLRYPARTKEYSKPIEVDWVNGAFLFFRSSVFRKIDGFDSNIFLYWEEMDLCERVRREGFKVMLMPEARILHYQGVSIGRSKTINKEAYRSYLYVSKKLFGSAKLLLLQIYLTFVLLFKPKKWYLIPTILEGGSMKNSLRKKQKSRPYES